MKNIGINELEIIENQVARKFNAPLTSSMGRLFDAVAALTGVRGIIQYEAQAAIDLEMLAYIAPAESDSYPFALEERDGMSVIKIRDLFTGIIKDISGKIPEAVIAARFHNTVAGMILKTCREISAKTGIKQVALSGGVFQNRLLLGKSLALLESAGFAVYTHHQVPCNDGGISLGQVAVANYLK
jgi:hydrogenase maturation protein HypF